MSTVKAAGTARNLRDSKPKFLGVKLQDGQKTNVGCILVRQRGTAILAGKNVKLGKDHTLYAMKDGTVKFTSKNKIGFDGRKNNFKVANVI